MGHDIAGGRGEISAIVTVAVALTRFTVFVTARLRRGLCRFLQQLVRRFSALLKTDSLFCEPELIFGVEG